MFLTETTTKHGSGGSVQPCSETLMLLIQRFWTHGCSDPAGDQLMTRSFDVL